MTAAEKTEHVYFIASKTGIKIGRSTDVKTRVTGISSANAGDVELLGAVIGGRELEASLHAALGPFAISGEWFADTPATRAIVERIVGSVGVKPECLLSDSPPRQGQQCGTTDEAIYVEMAAKILERLILFELGRGKTVSDALIAISAELNVAYGALWAIRYRPPKQITAGVWVALQGTVFGQEVTTDDTTHQTGRAG